MTAGGWGLAARTTPLPEPPDLLATAGSDAILWRDPFRGLAGHGAAMRIPLPAGTSDAAALAAVTEALASIETVDEVGLPGCGPVAIGALPFDPTAPGELVVPALVYGRDGDVGWVTTVGAEPAGAGARAAGGQAPGSAPPTGGGPPDEFRLVSSMPHREWQELVAAAVDAIRAGEIRKVVLARRIDIEANRDFVVSDVLERLGTLYPSCMVFSVEGFLGASPELLISRFGRELVSHPLAGTVARSGDVRGDQTLVSTLMASPKARHEHRVVVSGISEALAPYCDTLFVPDQPEVMGLRNVSHLGTRISGRLAAGPDSRPGLSALELVGRIHPTPAVGGTPTAAAIDYLQKAEGFDRGRYAGPVGWVDRHGDGVWAVGIRSAEVDGPLARIYAGNGIVAGSDPVDELAETQLKLQALLAALVRP